MDLWVVFLTGLAVGSFTCLAVQGGLLASVIAAREEEDVEKGISRRHTVIPIFSFLTAKLLAYMLLGFILGAFGGALSLSDTARTWMQFVAGFYMIAIALDLLKIHPILRYAVIQPPKFVVKMVKNQSKSKDLFAPAILGSLTVFIPCGTTLAMEALAISSGNAFRGGAIMAAFILGTTPLFFGLGFATTILGDTFRQRFFKLAALVVLYLGLVSVNGSLTALGSSLTFQNFAEMIPIEIHWGGEQIKVLDPVVKVIDGVQVAEIKVFPSSYSPDKIRVQAGVVVRLNLTTTGGYGCTSVFTIPQLGVRKRLPRDSTTTIDLGPLNPGKITWTCAMGMYTGIIEVI